MEQHDAIIVCPKCFLYSVPKHEQQLDEGEYKCICGYIGKNGSFLDDHNDFRDLSKRERLITDFNSLLYEKIRSRPIKTYSEHNIKLAQDMGELVELISISSITDLAYFCSTFLKKCAAWYKILENKNLKKFSLESYFGLSYNDVRDLFNILMGINSEYIYDDEYGYYMTDFNNDIEILDYSFGKLEKIIDYVQDGDKYMYVYQYKLGDKIKHYIRGKTSIKNVNTNGIINFDEMVFLLMAFENEIQVPKILCKILSALNFDSKKDNLSNLPQIYVDNFILIKELMNEIKNKNTERFNDMFKKHSFYCHFRERNHYHILQRNNKSAIKYKGGNKTLYIKPAIYFDNQQYEIIIVIVDENGIIYNKME